MKAKKVMAMCLVSTMLAGMVGETAISVSADDKLKVALVLPGKKDDVSFNQSIYEGVENFVANRKDIDLQVVENVYEVSDITPTLTEFADSGYDVVIGHGYQFTDPMIEVGAKYPDVNFLGGCTVKQSENVGSYDVHLEAGGYLMGVVAALAKDQKSQEGMKVLRRGQSRSIRLLRFRKSLPETGMIRAEHMRLRSVCTIRASTAFGILAMASGWAWFRLLRKRTNMYSAMWRIRRLLPLSRYSVGFSIAGINRLNRCSRTFRMVPLEKRPVPTRSIGLRCQIADLKWFRLMTRRERFLMKISR